MVTTSAPARANASGETRAAAPCASSRTTFSPSSRFGSTPMRWATYWSKPSVVVRDPADAGAGRPVPGLAGAVLLVDRLDPVLELVVELVAAAGEELDAVVRHGVVAGGEHHAEVGAQRAGEIRHRRGGQHTDPQDVHARAREARHDGGLQELAGRARIAPDHGHRPVALEGARLGEHMRRRDRQAERQLGGQVRVGDAAHAVRAEESSHCCPPRCSETVQASCSATAQAHA